MKNLKKKLENLKTFEKNLKKGNNLEKLEKIAKTCKSCQKWEKFGKVEKNWGKLGKA